MRQVISFLQSRMAIVSPSIILSSTCVDFERIQSKSSSVVEEVILFFFFGLRRFAVLACPDYKVAKRLSSIIYFLFLTGLVLG